MLEFFAAHYWLIWLTIAGVLLILEMSFGDFFLTCFAIGAFVAMLASFLPIPFWGQVVVFAIAGVACVCLLRPKLLHRIQANADHRESNVDALIGRTAMVVEPITPQKDGYVKVDGDEWRAKSVDNQPIGKGANVRIVSMESIIVTVAPIER